MKDGNIRYNFSRDKEIIPYIDQYWEAMTTMPRRVTQSWYATVQRALVKDVSLFNCVEHPENGPMFGLVVPDLNLIKPDIAVLNGERN